MGTRGKIVDVIPQVPISSHWPPPPPPPSATRTLVRKREVLSNFRFRTRVRVALQYVYHSVMYLGNGNQLSK